MSGKWATPPDHFGDRSDEWATPPDLLRPLSGAVGGFDLDPCSGAERRSIAANQYTAEDDGLTRPWFGTVWVNPPYSDLTSWLRKALNESNRGEVETILVLAPARTSTQWFHRYAARATALCFLEGRLTFGDDRQQVRNAPFPSLIAVFGAFPDDLAVCLALKGLVYRTDNEVRRYEQIALGEEVRPGGGD